MEAEVHMLAVLGSAVLPVTSNHGLLFLSRPVALWGLCSTLSLVRKLGGGPLFAALGRVTAQKLSSRPLQPQSASSLHSQFHSCHLRVYRSLL